MLKSRIPLLGELQCLQESGALTDTVLVGQGYRVWVHWAVLARFEFWQGLREVWETGPVTVILAGVGREELENIVHQAYRDIEEVVDDIPQDDEGWEQSGLRENYNYFGDNGVKVETPENLLNDHYFEDKVKDELENTYEADDLFLTMIDEDYENEDELDDDVYTAIAKLAKDIPEYIVCNEEEIIKSYSYIKTISTGEKVKTGPYAGSERVLHVCEFVNEEGVKCGFNKGKGIKHLLRHSIGHACNSFWCTLCKKNLKRPLEHIETKHKDRSWEKTLEERLEVSGFSCFKCDKKFLKKRSLDYHVNLVHMNIKNFHCNQCNYKGRTKGQLNNHTRVKHLKYGMCPCYICGKELADKSSLENHLLLHGEASFSCEFCGIKYKTDTALRLHRQNTHLEKKFICEFCSKSFSIKYKHDRHVLSFHTKIKNFACDKCDYKGTSNINLKRHVLVHSDVKRFQCQECGMKFRVKEALTRHMLVHTGLKPYKCTC